MPYYTVEIAAETTNSLYTLMASTRTHAHILGALYHYGHCDGLGITVRDAFSDMPVQAPTIAGIACCMRRSVSWYTGITPNISGRQWITMEPTTANATYTYTATRPTVYYTTRVAFTPEVLRWDAQVTTTAGDTTDTT